MVVLLFPLVSFTKSFPVNVFNEVNSAIHLARAMYSFLCSFFPLGFWKGFLTRYVDVAVFVQGGVLYNWHPLGGARNVCNEANSAIHLACVVYSFSLFLFFY